MKTHKWHVSESILDRLDSAIENSKDQERILLYHCMGKIIEDSEQRADATAGTRRRLNSISLFVAATGFYLSAMNLTGNLGLLVFALATVLVCFGLIVFMDPVFTKEGRGDLRKFLYGPR